MKARLTTITDIRNGYQFRGKVTPLEFAGDRNRAPGLPWGVVNVIQIKDIDDDRRLHTGDLITAQIDADPAKYEAREGDVLFLARGQRLFATAIEAPLRDTVATGYFFILRPKTEAVLHRYLAWYINQQPFQSVLRTYIKGTDQPLVSRKDIENLEVELPPLSIQKTIVALEDLRVKERRLLTELREKRSQLVQALSVKAARRHS